MTGCCFTDLVSGLIDDYTCKTYTTLFNDLKIIYGSEMNEILEENYGKQTYTWNISTVCSNLVKLANVTDQRVVDACECYGDEIT